jgi:thioesterase domain-containing protein
MLISVQPSGRQPPLFFLHDQHGIVPFGTELADVLGPDQPLHLIHANGIDGRQPILPDLAGMVPAYVAEIHGARPFGPLVLGGLGSGCLLAIEIARELQERGRQVGPVILANPPPLAGSVPVREQPVIAPRQPVLDGQLYHSVRGALLAYASRGLDGLPFDAGNAKQLHAATLAGVALHVAFGKHAPTPFAGPAEVMLPAEAAEEFFNPQMAWQELLPGSHIVHVLPWDRDELFRSGLEAAMQVLKFLVEEAVEALSGGALEASVA